MVEAIIVRGVGLSVVRRRQNCHLVAIDAVVTEKEFHFLRDLHEKYLLFEVHITICILN